MLLSPSPASSPSCSQFRGFDSRHVAVQYRLRPSWQQRRASRLLLPSVLPSSNRSQRHALLPRANANEGWRNTVSTLFERAEDAGRRAAGNIDRTLHITETAKRATESTQTAVVNGSSWLEERLDLKKRSRRIVETIRRDYPKWQQQLQAFNSSMVGRVFWAGVLVWSIYSGFIWTVVRFVFVLTWLLPLLIAVLARRFSKQVAAVQAQQRAGARQEQELYSQSFSSAFRQSAFQQSVRSGPQPGRGRTGSGKPGPDFAQQPGGPIIDVESVTVDEND